MIVAAAVSSAAFKIIIILIIIKSTTTRRSYRLLILSLFLSLSLFHLYNLFSFKKVYLLQETHTRKQKDALSFDENDDNDDDIKG